MVMVSGTPISMRRRVVGHFFSHGAHLKDCIGFYCEENRCESSVRIVTAGAVDTVGHSGIIGVTRCSGWIWSHCNSDAWCLKQAPRVPESSVSEELERDLPVGRSSGARELVSSSLEELRVPVLGTINRNDVQSPAVFFPVHSLIQ